MCGLFGIVNYSRAKTDTVSKLVKSLADESTSRGTDAGGLAYYGDKGVLTVVKNHRSIKTNGVLDFEDAYKSAIIMGHTRATTQGLATKNQNNHPFMSVKGEYALAHNGVLSNDDDVMTVLKLESDDVETDSYVLVRMIDQLYDGVISFETLRECGEKLGGTYNFTVIDGEGNLWVVRHNNPLTIIDFKELGLIAYSSTGEIMMDALKTFYGGGSAFTEYLFERTSPVPFGRFIHTVSGDILKIDRTGKVTRERFEPASKIISDPNKKPLFNYYTDTSGKKYWYSSRGNYGSYDDYEDEMLKDYSNYYKNQSFTPTVKKSDELDVCFYDKLFGSGLGTRVNDRAIIFNGRELEDVDTDSGRYIGEVFSGYRGEYIEFPDEHYTIPRQTILDGLTFEDLSVTKGNFDLKGAEFGKFIGIIKKLESVIDLTEYIKMKLSKTVAKELIKMVYLYAYLRLGAVNDETLYVSTLNDYIYNLWAFQDFSEMYEHMISFIYYEYYAPYSVDIEF